MSNSDKSPESETRVFGRLKKSFKQILSPKEDKLAKELAKFQSLQACKDASLTGEVSERLIAVARLAEFGQDGVDEIDIAMLDDDERVRAAAIIFAAMVGGKSYLDSLRNMTTDDSLIVKSAVDYALYIAENSTMKLESDDDNTPTHSTSVILSDDEIPLRTSDDVFIKNDYSTGVDTLDFEVTIVNEDDDAITDVEVKLLAYPSESLIHLSESSKLVDKIDADSTAGVTFSFRAVHECVEGELITSVTFEHESGERFSAKAGNCFVRSFYDWVQPVEISKEEFEQRKTSLRHWSREHQIIRDPQELYDMFEKTIRGSNLYIYHNEIVSDKKAFMAALGGMGKGIFTGLQISVSIIIVGDLNENVAKIRLEVFSDNPEILHTAASELYETTLRLLGEI